MNLNGAEIMGVGDPDGRGVRFTESDLQAIVDSFAGLQLKGRIPLKLGHNDQQPMTDGQPALGWVSRVWREGQKLMADFTDMPEIVYNAVKRGLYKFVSVELLQNVQAGTRRIPWVLDAVALLGADQPAFGNLKDLQSLTLRRGSILSSGTRVSFKRAKFTTTITEGKQMDQAEVQALIDKAVGTVTQKFTADIEKINADNKAALDAKDAELKKVQCTNHRKEVLAVFNIAIEEGRIEPAIRERFEKLTKLANDERVLEVSLEDAKAFIKDNEKAPAKHKSKFSTKGNGSGDDEEVTGTPIEQLGELANRLCLSRNQDPTKFEFKNAAIKDILRTNKELAKSYFDDPNGTEEAA